MKELLISLVLTLAITVSGVVGYSLAPDKETIIEVEVEKRIPAKTEFGVLDEVQNILNQYYVDPSLIDLELLRTGSINGMLDILGDPHTVYIDPLTMSVGLEFITGSFQGIGARVDQDAFGNVIIIAPFRNSPAERAGVRAGDVILAVDGESTEGWSTFKAVQNIRGPEGSAVVITVRHSDGVTEDITIIRDVIIVPTVFSNLGNDPDTQIYDATGNIVTDIAYIELQQFTDETAPLLRVALELAEQGDYRALILDLRRNPGGGLRSVIQVADMFLGEGRIISQVNRNNQERFTEARPGDEPTDLPIVVLIGPGSASAAEVLAAALQDNDQAVLMGELTFGKGTINQLFNLSDGGAIYISTARWLTPNGIQIEGVGIFPDIPNEDDLDTREDEQIFEAIKYLRGE